MHSLNGVSERRAAELNSKALEHFIYQPVSRDMINYLADAARNVIPCDSSYDLPTPPRTPEPADKSLPTLEEFITQLVTSSNVQVPTLMSSLVYLNRLKSRLQPQARGLKCTTHRIFLAALILAAKYLNDSSPKNKHWARYTNMETDWYQFGFNRTEVNLMEKQLLFLLEWKLRITNEDLYAEFEPFLEPLRLNIIDREARKQREAEERYAAAAAAAAASQYSSPAPSREQSRSRRYSPEHARAHSGGSISPPDLVSSSASSYASSIASSRHNSRSATPDESDPTLTDLNRAASTTLQFTSTTNSSMATPLTTTVARACCLTRSQWSSISSSSRTTARSVRGAASGTASSAARSVNDLLANLGVSCTRLDLIMMSD